MTKEEIKEKIKTLEEDNEVLHDCIYTSRPSVSEKAEIRSRIKANNLELIRLKNALVCINDDK